MSFDESRASRSSVNLKEEACFEQLADKPHSPVDVSGGATSPDNDLKDGKILLAHTFNLCQPCGSEGAPRRSTEVSPSPRATRKRAKTRQGVAGESGARTLKAERTNSSPSDSRPIKSLHSSQRHGADDWHAGQEVKVPAMQPQPLAAKEEAQQGGTCAERNCMKVLVRLQEEKDVHKDRCKRLAQRITMEETELGRLLVEAERYKMAAEQRAATIREDRLAARQEQRLLEEKSTELVALHRSLRDRDGGQRS